MQVFEKLIIDLLEQHKEQFTKNNAYIYNNIPKHKLENALKNHKLHKNEKIFWLVDLTLSGSAKDSTILTNYGIYFLQTLLGDKTQKKILWTQIEQIYYTDKEGFVFLQKDGKKIFFDRMHFDVYSKKDKKQIETMLKVFEEIKEYASFNSDGLPLNEKEQQFIDDISFMLADDFQISDTEKQILESLSKKYNLTKQRSQELINKLIEKSTTNEEWEYFILIKKLLSEKKQINENDRRALEYYAKRLNLSPETIKKLENLAIKVL